MKGIKVHVCKKGTPTWGDIEVDRSITHTHTHKYQQGWLIHRNHPHTYVDMDSATYYNTFRYRETTVCIQYGTVHTETR